MYSSDTTIKECTYRDIILMLLEVCEEEHMGSREGMCEVIKDEYDVDVSKWYYKPVAGC